MALQICSNMTKLVIVLTLTTLYFFAEIIVGTWIRAISLVTDAFHMLSDVVSIIIGVIAMRVSKLPRSGTNTFGWQRAEVFGTLINCVSLMALSFTIIITAIQRFVFPEKITDPFMMLIVSVGGMVVNLISISLLSQSHSHSHSQSHVADRSSVKLPDYVKITDEEGEPILVVMVFLE